MSDSGTAGTGAGSSTAGRSAAGNSRRDGDSGMDERSQRLLQGGAASRAWADTAARETVRSESGGGATRTAATTYQVGNAATATSAPTSAATTSRSGQPRRARLRVSHVNPMSVLRLSLLFGLCMLVVLLVAVAALWFVLNKAGVFSSITDATSTITDNSNSGTGAWFSFGRVMLITAVLGVLNVIAFTLLSTVGSLLYNLCSDFVGGVEVTLSER